MENLYERGPCKSLCWKKNILKFFFFFDEEDLKILMCVEIGTTKAIQQIERHEHTKSLSKQNDIVVKITQIDETKIKKQKGNQISERRGKRKP